MQILLSIDKQYNLPYQDNDFLYPFILHVYYLVRRAREHIYLNNPMLVTLKSDYPATFDVSVSLAAKIENQFNIQISEEETGFLAFYLGSWLQKFRGRNEKISFFVITNNYLNYNMSLIHRLHMLFGDQLHFLGFILKKDFLPQRFSQYLILSTISDPLESQYLVKIDPIISHKDISNIRKTINRIIDEKEFNCNTSIIKKMLQKDLYFETQNKLDPQMAITFLCNKALKKKLVSKNFLDDVLKRERLASTAFVNYLATPHALNLNSKKDFIAVLRSKKPIHWQNKNIYFVMLIGITKKNNKIFRQILEFLIKKFSSIQEINQLLSFDSFEQFAKEITKPFNE